MRVLIVEDETRLAEALGQILQEARYQTDVVYDGQDGFDYAVSGQYDAIVLDVMLPKLDGFTVARQLRRERIATPVILLTARGETGDKVTGLDCGADDYMTKPFAPEELLARLRAVLRRQGEVALEEVCFHDLTLNLTTNTALCGGKSVRLGYKEFEILRLLLAGPGRIVPKEDLLVKVWGMESDAQDNNVEVYISFLRKKLAFLGSHVTIGTVRKVGYLLEESK